jgi:protein-S-isoprenylcysteine O-methyltransferase Ste14
LNPTQEKVHSPEGRFGNRGEHLVALQALLIALFVLTPPWPGVQDGWPGFATPLRWLLISICWTWAVLFGVGGLKAIRQYLTPLPYPVDDNQLVVTGAYRLIRHPLYSAIMFSFAGWTIFSVSLTHLLVTLLAILFFRHKASKEEAWLTRRHPYYPDYASRTGRFVPRLTKRRAMNATAPDDQRHI